MTRDSPHVCRRADWLVVQDFRSCGTRTHRTGNDVAVKKKKGRTTPTATVSTGNSRPLRPQVLLEAASLTHILWGAHDLSELLVVADHPGQTKVNDLDIPHGSIAGQQNILGLSGGKHTSDVVELGRTGA